MAAAKLGAGRVLALDVDGVAARVASENVAANHLKRKVNVLQGTVPLSGEARELGYSRFDVIVANLTGTILCRIAQHLRVHLRDRVRNLTVYRGWKRHAESPA